jgi:hypothetical protein
VSKPLNLATKRHKRLKIGGTYLSFLCLFVANDFESVMAGPVRCRIRLVSAAGEYLANNNFVFGQPARDLEKISS